MKNRKSLYLPGDLLLWKGRQDSFFGEYIYQQVIPLDLSSSLPLNYPKDSYFLLGFQSDEGVVRNLGNAGAFDGPNTFRQFFSRLPLHSQFKLYDAGNVVCVNGDLESAQQELATRIDQILNLGVKPIVIGGGHEIAWGHYQGIHKHFIKHSKESVAILNFDAHFDLRPLDNGIHGTSGTPFRQCNDLLTAHQQTFNYYCVGIQPFSNTKSLFEYAKTNNVDYRLAEDINANPQNLDFIQHIINSHNKLYVTICLDVFQESIAPGVSAPQPFGIGVRYVFNALKILKNSKKVVSLDIAELSPSLDINNQTSRLAGSLLMRYLDDY
jgi:formiminoglutamase